MNPASNARHAAPHSAALPHAPGRQAAVGRHEAAGLDVPDAFDAIAHHYDRMVGMSPGYHDQLRSSAQALVEALDEARTVAPDASDAASDVVPRPAAGGDEGARRSGVPLVLDIGCGSGASTAALVAEFERAGIDVEILAVDGSAAMLAAARGKTWPAHVRFAQARAEDLLSPESGLGVAPGSVDGIFAAYLVRNVSDKDGLLGDLSGLLRGGAPLVIHDYLVRGDPLATACWHALNWTVIIPLSLVMTGKPGLFVYLWRSVLRFDSVLGLARRLDGAGFEQIRHRRVPGWQKPMVHTLRARKPQS